MACLQRLMTNLLWCLPCLHLILWIMLSCWKDLRWFLVLGAKLLTGSGPTCAAVNSQLLLTALCPPPAHLSLVFCRVQCLDHFVCSSAVHCYINNHGCDYHKYADDTESSKKASPMQFLTAQTGTETCIDDLLCWMNTNIVISSSLTQIRLRSCL